MDQVEFVGEVAEIRTLIGDRRMPDGSNVPCVIVEGVKKSQNGRRELAGWECQVLVLRATEIQLAMQGQQEQAAHGPKIQGFTSTGFPIQG